ncbi:hypothetical protein DXG01_003317 [Tephrocybe rancida]|nr:hypothetical protein DXG01_003317 [Tephrocybe rancida]
MASSSITEAQMKSEIARLTATINQRKSLVSTHNPGHPRTNSRNNTYVNPNYKPSNKYIRANQSAVPSPPAQAPTPRPPVKPPTMEVKDVVINGIAFESSGRSLVRKDLPKPVSAGPSACSRGLTCLYQHDPAKIAICWNFLQGNCSQTAETCALSHDPTPERTPLCLHYLNKGRCTRDNCPFPHVNVGTRQGVCRDFAVLGYCDKGLDCDEQHVRECPDFAENGTCSTKGCKLPHVIRANRTRKPTAKPVDVAATSTAGIVTPATDSSEEQLVASTANRAQLGDEYISLTFNESESEEDDSEEQEDEGDDDDDDMEDQEGSDPNSLEPDPE